MIKITGLEGLQRKLQQLKRNAESIEGNNEVPFTELFPPSFMQRYTRFESIQLMIDASGIDEPEQIGGEAWESFVVGHSDFPSWEKMKETAGSEWAKRKLGL